MYNNYFNYLKQIIISDIGLIGQDILSKKNILCIGTGGLGSPVLTYLLIAGIKKLGIAEFDTVDITNLNRQFIFNKNDINKKKLDCTKEYITKINNKIKINYHKKKISYANSFNIIKKYDLVIDCTDNSESKMIISDSAVRLNIPVIYASVFGLQGHISIFKKNVFCYRCLSTHYKNLEYIEYGVIGAIAGLVGCIQVIETIKLILNNTKNEFQTLESKIMILDFKKLNFKILKVKKNNNCNIC